MHLANLPEIFNHVKMSGKSQSTKLLWFSCHGVSSTFIICGKGSCPVVNGTEQAYNDNSELDPHVT